MRTVPLVVAPGRERLTADVPESRRERMRGLIGREPLPRGRVMLLERTRSIHTFGLRFPIRVALLDRGGTILEVRIVRPRRLLLPHRSVFQVLESSPRTNLRPGQVVRPTGRCPS